MCSFNLFFIFIQSRFNRFGWFVVHPRHPSYTTHPSAKRRVGVPILCSSTGRNIVASEKDGVHEKTTIYHLKPLFVLQVVKILDFFCFTLRRVSLVKRFLNVHRSLFRQLIFFHSAGLDFIMPLTKKRKLKFQCFVSLLFSCLRFIFKRNVWK